ncbi:MAG TPA: M14 family zinc carboxypeptidase [Bacteriovoracaceae bacterium]|nr:M14 family zinc carboxypeptidase [Bacteriovoracaceae bacterium]
MKNYLALSLLAVALPTLASVKIEEEIYIVGQSPEVVKELVAAGSGEVDHVSSEGFELYASKGVMDYLDKKNIVYFDMKEVSKKVFADYPSHAEITKKLMAAQAKNPRIFKLFTIGKSIKGKELLVMKISDNVDADEVEPEFKYISSMHGDEITGRELTVSLIEEIAENYGRDARITELVNNTELYIMPSMNPDGSELRQRGNAKGIDLNRNFPDMTRDRQSTIAGREIENQAVMKFQSTRQFALSANFHGGTIVVNYPWDSKYDLHPLNDFIVELSLVYAEANPEMTRSTEFPQGITNGAAWYVVKGGMQDWSYVWHNDLQVTVELSHEKWPSYSEIPGFYRSNRESMFNFMKEIHRGAGFSFGRRNVQGTVAIKQVSPAAKDLGSYAFNSSEFYKVLPEGDYTFTITEKNKAAKNLNVRVEKDSIRTNGNYARLN